LEGIKTEIDASDSRVGVLGAVLAREQHKDGSWHIHVLLRVVGDGGGTPGSSGRGGGGDGRRTIKYADLDSLFGGRVGNWQAPRSANAVLKYVTKEEDYIEWGMDIKLMEKLGKMKKSLKYAKLMNKETTLISLVEEDPIMLEKLETLKRSIDLYHQLKVNVNDRPKCLLIILTGPSGAGKTTFVTQFCQQRNLRKFDLKWDRDGKPLAEHYDNEQVLSIDNVQNKNVPQYEWILRLTDPTHHSDPITADAKYGITKFLIPQYCFITSIEEPESWWASTDRHGTVTTKTDEQLYRRIHFHWRACWDFMEDKLKWMPMDYTRFSNIEHVDNFENQTLMSQIL
jgi:hypothetical protein